MTNYSSFKFYCFSYSSAVCMPPSASELWANWASTVWEGPHSRAFLHQNWDRYLCAPCTVDLVCRSERQRQYISYSCCLRGGKRRSMGSRFCVVGIYARLVTRLTAIFTVVWLCFCMADGRQLQTENKDGMWKYRAKRYTYSQYCVSDDSSFLWEGAKFDLPRKEVILSLLRKARWYWTVGLLLWVISSFLLFSMCYWCRR